MAKHAQRSHAVQMRKNGASYSQIKKALSVSKSTLSLWLRGLPLSQSRMRELRDHSEQRIESFRETMRKKRNLRIDSVYKISSRKIGSLSKRELFMTGVFLYWAEGTKGARSVFMATNTDPAMLRFFLVWLTENNIPRSKIRAKLHLYKGMNIKEETLFWSKALSLPMASFGKPYIKETSFEKRKNYKGRFGHGTCNVIVYNRDLYELVMTGIQYLRNKYGGVDFAPKQEI